jgi:energy-converting hydrogenase B subunit D
VTALQLACLATVAITGTAVVAVREPLRQIVVAGFFGLALAALFLVYGAPDVALSQITVGSVAVPAMVLLALAKLAERDKEDEP